MTGGEILQVMGHLLKDGREEIKDVEEITRLLKDPLAVGLLITALIEERRKTNVILQRVLNELRGLKGEREEVVDLSDTDERIVRLIQERGMVTAEDVKEALGYKGLNGASARLNALYKRGLLRKVRRGRKVYFALA